MPNSSLSRDTVPVLALPFFAEPSEASRFLLPHRVAERLRKDFHQKARQEFQPGVRKEADLAKQDVQEAEAFGPKRVQQDRTKSRFKKVVHNEVQVFCMEQVDHVWNTTWSQQVHERRSRAESWFKAVREDAGKRTVPALRASSLNNNCQKLCTTFPHFHAVIEHLKAELMLAVSSKPSNFRVSPILLHGAPGIGKTTFTSALAEALKVPSEVISAGSSQGSFEIYGTSAHWDNAEVGKVFRLLADGPSAVGVLVIDEIDKIEPDGRYPIIPALLDLLEVQTARRFRDEAAGIRFDASKIIIIATANELHPISSALLSRLHSIEIPEPTIEERLCLLKDMFSSIQKVAKPKIVIADEVLSRIAQAPGDLREMQRILRISIGNALARKKREIETVDLCFSNIKPAQAIGFIQ